MQLGAESTAGTGVAATTRWRGGGTIQDDLDLVFVEEDTGYIGGTDRSYIQKYDASLEMDDVEATFEQLPYLGMAGIVNATPVVDGPGTGYAYAFPFPTTSQATIKTYTIEGGDDQQEEEFSYGFVEQFKLSGRAGEALKMAATWRGRQVSASTFTGALSPPAVEEIKTIWHALDYNELRDSSEHKIKMSATTRLALKFQLVTSLIVTGKQIGRASCRERVCLYV